MALLVLVISYRYEYIGEKWNSIKNKEPVQLSFKILIILMSHDHISYDSNVHWRLVVLAWEALGPIPPIPKYFETYVNYFSLMK